MSNTTALNSTKQGPECKKGIKKVQVGCGPENIMPDWWNVDIRAFKGIDQVMDVTQPWNFKGIEYIYGEHFLEHLSLDGAVAFLRNAQASFKEGGVIRLSTPSLEWVLSTHFKLDEKDSEKRLMSTFAINRAFHGWGHQFLYSKEFIEDLLKNTGYTNIKFCRYGESEHPALENLERHGGYRVVKEYPSVWIIEATKKQSISQGNEERMRYKSELDNLYVRYIRGGH